MCILLFGSECLSFESIRDRKVVISIKSSNHKNLCVKIMKWNKLEMRNMGHVWHDQYIWAKNWLFLAVEGPKNMKIGKFWSYKNRSSV